MISTIIEYLNLQLESLGYFNKMLCLASRIERGGQIFPAVQVQNEFTQINLDSYGSVSYWRLNGEPSYSESESTTKVGNDYTSKIPLRLIGYIKRSETDSEYLSDIVIEGIKGVLTTNANSLRTTLKAKRINIAVVKSSTNWIDVASSEYTNVEFEPRYDTAYFSMDFEVTIISNQSCFNDVCNDLTAIHCGNVRIVDENGNLITTVECGGTYVDAISCEDVTVHNSDNTYTVTVAAGSDLSLSDIDFNIYVNGVLNQTFSTPSMVDNTINISN